MVEGAPHTAKRSKGSIVVSMGCPPPLYIKGGGGEGRPRGRGAPKGGNPTPSRIPPSFLVQVGEGKEGEEEKKERGTGPLVQFGLG